MFRINRFITIQNSNRLKTGDRLIVTSSVTKDGIDSNNDMTIITTNNDSNNKMTVLIQIIFFRNVRI